MKKILFDEEKYYYSILNLVNFKNILSACVDVEEFRNLHPVTYDIILKRNDNDSKKAYKMLISHSLNIRGYSEFDNISVYFRDLKPNDKLSRLEYMAPIDLPNFNNHRFQQTIDMIYFGEMKNAISPEVLKDVRTIEEDNNLKNFALNLCKGDPVTLKNIIVSHNVSLVAKNLDQSLGIKTIEKTLGKDYDSKNLIEIMKKEQKDWELSQKNKDYEYKQNNYVSSETKEKNTKNPNQNENHKNIKNFKKDQANDLCSNLINHVFEINVDHVDLERLLSLGKYKIDLV